MSNFDFSIFSFDLLRSFVGSGLAFSVQLTVIAMLGGILIGTVLALMRLSGVALLEIPARIYVDGLRSIPLVMVILWVYLLIPLFLGRPIGKELSAIVTFTIFEAAYYSEIMRAGIQSISRGQVFAGQAIGLTYAQNMRHVILPQAFRNMLPVLLTQTIVLFQDTSLVYAIGAYDLLHGFETLGKNYGRTVETYVAAAVVYFVICFSLSTVVKRLQKKIAIIR
jgi:glutamate/aspartate transport system permease protein